MCFAMVGAGTVHPAQAFFLENIEPDFDLVQPGAMKRGENEFNPAVLLGQPVFDQFGFVRIQIIKDNI